MVSDAKASDWTMLLQTTGLTSCATGGPAINATNVTVQLAGGFCPTGCSLQLWHSNITSHFMQVPGEISVPASGGGDTQAFSLSLLAGSLYTLSTIQTAKKGSHGAIPPAVAFPMPFSTGFAGLRNDTLAPYFCDQSGSFSVEVGAGKGGGNAIKQRVTRDPTVRSQAIQKSTIALSFLRVIACDSRSAMAGSSTRIPSPSLAATTGVTTRSRRTSRS